MSAKNDMIRIRNTKATRRRVENITILLTRMAMGEMFADEICDTLKCTASGSRKYIRDLEKAGIIEITRFVKQRKPFIGNSVYRLSADSEKIKNYLTLIEQPTIEAKPRAQSMKQQAISSGRHLHIMSDDAHYTVRMHTKKVARDALVTALFGDGPAKVEE